MPLTSINPAFERLLEQQAGGKFGPNAGIGATKRLIVYNKADLAQECFQEVRIVLFFYAFRSADIASNSRYGKPFGRTDNKK